MYINQVWFIASSRYCARHLLRAIKFHYDLQLALRIDDRQSATTELDASAYMIKQPHY